MILKVKMMQNKREKHTLAAQTSESLDQLISGGFRGGGQPPLIIGFEDFLDC